jgi:predicted nucleic-acid-binding Zn-ribbon protein
MKIHANRVEACLYGGNANAERNCLEDLKLIVPSVDGPHRHTFRVCPTCGQLEWMWSKPADKESFVLDYQENEFYGKVSCSECGEAFQRNPELFSIMLNAISHALHMEKRKEKEVENA